MAPWDAIANIGEGIGNWGSNIDVPSLFGQGGPGPAPYNYSSWSPSSQGQPAAPSADYLSAAKEYGQSYGLMTGTINAQPAMIQNQMERQQAGIGMMGALANQTQETGYLNQDYDIGQRKLANEYGRLGIEQGANKRQPGFLSSLHDIAGKGFDLTRQGEAAQANQNRRALESSLTAKGAFTSVGGQQGRFDIASDLLRQTQGTNLEQQGETVHYFENMAQVNDQKAKLDLAAKDLGISGDQLKNDLQRGLDRLNLGTATSVADLTSKINSTDLQEAAMARKIWNDALQSGDYYARFFPGQNAAQGTYGPEGSGQERTYSGGGGARVR